MFNKHDRLLYGLLFPRHLFCGFFSLSYRLFTVPFLNIFDFSLQSFDHLCKVEWYFLFSEHLFIPFDLLAGLFLIEGVEVYTIRGGFAIVQVFVD